MKTITVAALLMLSTSSFLLFDFTKQSNIQNWIVVDDGVMGGKSEGIFSLNENGHATFSGYVSTENNGGFSSVRYQFPKVAASNFSFIKLKVRGDGKNYQLRLKANSKDYVSYVSNFETSNKWQTIKIPIRKMYPTFRGRNLDLPNFNHAYFEEIGILIGNKRSEKFKLEIDSIELE